MRHTCILRVVRKVSDQVEMAAATEERPKLVRRRTWTKEEAEAALKRQEEIRVSRATVAERVMTSCLQVETSEFQGARKITNVEYQAGDRYDIHRQEDHLKLGLEVGALLSESPQKKCIEFETGLFWFTQ